jgi:DNA-binding transcriptional regulator GbsR (MarR family)
MLGGPLLPGGRPTETNRYFVTRIAGLDRYFAYMEMVGTVYDALFLSDHQVLQI